MNHESIPFLIAEIVRLKSNIQSRNFMVYELREITKKTNSRDTKRIKEIQEKINFLKR